MSDYQDTEVSSFNEAGLAIMRLNNIWVDVEEQVSKGNLSAWRWKLDGIWRELYPDVVRMGEQNKTKSEPDNKYIKDWEEFERRWKKAKTRSQYYEILHAKHCFLKVLQSDAGKGGSYRSTTENDFE